MIARTRRFAVAVLALTSAALTAPVASAQQTAVGGSAGRDAAAAQPLAAGPTVDRAAVGARRLDQQPASDADARAVLQQRLGLGQARAMMIVGFAAVVIGLLMDNDPGTLIAIGGAVVGLYGLYNYLR